MGASDRTLKSKTLAVELIEGVVLFEARRGLGHDSAMSS